MKMTTLGLGLVLLTIVFSPPDAAAQIIDNCYATIAADEPASLYSLPDFGGDSLDNAYAYSADRIDATITVYVLDMVGNPIQYYPLEDIWLDGAGGEFVFCPGGTVADYATDENGVTTISGPFAAGGSVHPADHGMVVLLNGSALYQPPFALGGNSPDINGDLVVNLSDAVMFAQDYGVVYRYRNDFNWDGIVNLSDVVFLVQGLGATCP
jgi:hypothetical protein